MQILLYCVAVPEAAVRKCELARTLAVRFEKVVWETGRILRFHRGAASAADVTFAANSNTILKFDNPSAFTGTVSGLSTGDLVDL
jgi:hypothetical protein